MVGKTVNCCVTFSNLRYTPFCPQCKQHTSVCFIITVSSCDLCYVYILLLLAILKGYSNKSGNKHILVSSATLLPFLSSAYHSHPSISCIMHMYLHNAHFSVLNRSWWPSHPGPVDCKFQGGCGHVYTFWPYGRGHHFGNGGRPRTLAADTETFFQQAE